MSIAYLFAIIMVSSCDTGAQKKPEREFRLDRLMDLSSFYWVEKYVWSKLFWLIPT